MKTRWLVVWLAAINLAMGVSSTKGGFRNRMVCALGGLAFGWIYLLVSSIRGMGQLPSVGILRFQRNPRHTRALALAHVVTRDDHHDGIDEVCAKSNAVAAKPAKPARSAIIPRAHHRLVTRRSCPLSAGCRFWTDLEAWNREPDHRGSALLEDIVAQAPEGRDAELAETQSSLKSVGVLFSLELRNAY